MIDLDNYSIINVYRCIKIDNVLLGVRNFCFKFEKFAIVDNSRKNRKYFVDIMNGEKYYRDPGFFDNIDGLYALDDNNSLYNIIIKENFNYKKEFLQFCKDYLIDLNKKDNINNSKEKIIKKEFIL